ncbi:MAG: hypothetical protein PQJ58_12895, partial [Spirochaetales bacterium]|nr:hypothetical protein [Spirochaetales bacterium]
MKRCLDWAENFERINILVLNRDTAFDYRNHPLTRKNSRIQWVEGTQQEDWELLILDNRFTIELPESLSGIPLIALDETGPLRNRASYVMDLLPGLKDLENNRNGFPFLKRTVCTEPPGSLHRILVSFGGEDSSDLADIFAAAL